MAPPQNAALRVGYCNDETGTIQAVLAAFAAENSEITVTAETYASHDELLIKLISGDVPDVLWFHGELATLQSLARKGLLRDLERHCRRTESIRRILWKSSCVRNARRRALRAVPGIFG